MQRLTPAGVAGRLLGVRTSTGPPYSDLFGLGGGTPLGARTSLRAVMTPPTTGVRLSTPGPRGRSPWRRHTARIPRPAAATPIGTPTQSCTGWATGKRPVRVWFATTACHDILTLFPFRPSARSSADGRLVVTSVRSSVPRGIVSSLSIPKATAGLAVRIQPSPAAVASPVPQRGRLTGRRSVRSISSWGCCGGRTFATTCQQTPGSGRGRRRQRCRGR